MTPQRAQLIAASMWLGEANHRGWMNDVSTVLEAAAGGSGVFGPDAENDEASAGRQGVSMELPLPRDTALIEHDPTLDTLHSADELAAALVSPTEASVSSGLRSVTAKAAKEAKDAIAEAAATTTRAANSAKVARALATADAARAMTEVVSRTAAAVRLQTDARAATATGVDATTAANLAQEADLAAVVVARAAAEAAMQAASAAADAAMMLELEVSEVAADVAAVAEAAMLRLAVHTEAAADLLQTAKINRGGGPATS